MVQESLSGKLEFEWTLERHERLSGGRASQAEGIASAKLRQGGGRGAA